MSSRGACHLPATDDQCPRAARLQARLSGGLGSGGTRSGLHVGAARSASLVADQPLLRAAARGGGAPAGQRRRLQSRATDLVPAAQAGSIAGALQAPGGAARGLLRGLCDGAE